jgi:uncharacterized protein YbjT (DUF2867 family)
VSAPQALAASLIGATGLVGRELLQLLLDDDRVGTVHAFGRRSVGFSHGKLVEHVIDFDTPPSWRSLVVGEVLFSALGTTLRAAGSEQKQYKVDYTYQHEFAKAARSNGVATCVLISSAGASPGSRNFYLRMKGELERDIEALGFERTRILRPSLLDGDRRELRVGERLALTLLRPLSRILPAQLRPVPVRAVAQAAVSAGLDPAAGLIRYEPGILLSEA